MLGSEPFAWKMNCLIFDSKKFIWSVKEKLSIYFITFIAHPSFKQLKGEYLLPFTNLQQLYEVGSFSAWEKNTIFKKLDFKNECSKKYTNWQSIAAGEEGTLLKFAISKKFIIIFKKCCCNKWVTA